MVKYSSCILKLLRLNIYLLIIPKLNTITTTAIGLL